jgi:hypothetical protein
LDDLARTGLKGINDRGPCVDFEVEWRLEFDKYTVIAKALDGYNRPALPAGI